MNDKVEPLAKQEYILQSVLTIIPSLYFLTNFYYFIVNTVNALLLCCVFCGWGWSNTNNGPKAVNEFA